MPTSTLISQKKKQVEMLRDSFPGLNPWMGWTFIEYLSSMVVDSGFHSIYDSNTSFKHLLIYNSILKVSLLIVMKQSR